MAGVLVLCATSGHVFAQAKHSFDLDVPAARASFWTIEDIGTASGVVADLEIRELRRDSQWKPTFQVALHLGDQRVAVRFVREPGRDDLTVRVQAMESGKVIGERPIDGWTLRKGQRFQLELDWSAAGSVRVVGNGKDWGHYQLAFAPRSITVSASTGELFGHSVTLTGK